MSFTVTWLDEAVEEYFHLWSDPRLREAILPAGQRIEATLELSPNEVGESRPDNVRIIFEPPLAAIYEVFLYERKVNIIRIWYYSKR
jgi:hypothetical protein